MRKKRVHIVCVWVFWGILNGGLCSCLHAQEEAPPPHQDSLTLVNIGIDLAGIQLTAADIKDIQATWDIWYKELGENYGCLPQITFYEDIQELEQDFNPADLLFEVEFDAESNHLWILLAPENIEPLAGKTVCFGIWQRSGAVRWSREKGTYRKTVTVFTRIGGDLPGKFLPPDFGNPLSIAARRDAAVRSDG